MADEFSRSVARVVAAQIAEASGFDACQESAIEILADLLLRYLTTVCSSSHSYAELAGRSQSNLADLLLSLEELGVTAEDLHQHLELQRSDVPFAHTLAPFPVRTQRPVPPTLQTRRAPPGTPAGVPAGLPRPPHLPAHGSVCRTRADPHKQRQSMLEAKQKAEAALNKLHQRMSSKAAQPDINPFLVAPAVEQLPAQLPAATVGAAAAAPAPAPAVQQQMLQHHLPLQLQRSMVAAHMHLHQLPLTSSSNMRSCSWRKYSLSSRCCRGVDDEDVLFEQAAVLKAFSSILHTELIAKELRGGLQEDQQQQQQRDKQPHELQKQQLDDMGVVEEQPMDVDGEGPAAAGGQGPQDMYEQQAKQQGRVAGVGGARQRKSKYDADPKLAQAEGILNLGPEAVFNAVGGMHNMWDTGNGME
ncbi:Bromodomain associated-domain-containing protein [Scenedesmus sp. NREL 46B-D3]|nr:Bromodomain associated-domain-containing protein [Scenedesmus sp. NREL 46B-D3]